MRAEDNIAKASVRNFKYMANITNIEQIKLIGNLTKVADDKIKCHLAAAKSDAVDIIGIDKYTELSALEETNEDKILAGSGEARLALCYIMPAINIVSSGMGITRSTGFNDTRVENLSETELENMIERYKREALNILNKFIPSANGKSKQICNTGIVKIAAIGEANE